MDLSVLGNKKCKLWISITILQFDCHCKRHILVFITHKISIIGGSNSRISSSLLAAAAAAEDDYWGVERNVKWSREIQTAIEKFYLWFIFSSIFCSGTFILNKGAVQTFCHSVELWLMPYFVI